MKALFRLENGVLKPSEHVFGVKVFTDIMEEFPDENDHLKAFQFVYYMTSLDPDNNPFFNFRDSEKEEAILEQLGDISFSTEDESIIEALKFCEEAEITSIGRAYLGIKSMLDKVSDHMRTVSITSEGKDSNLTALVGLASKFESIRQSFEGSLDSLKKEQKGKVRGNQRISYDLKNI